MLDMLLSVCGPASDIVALKSAIATLLALSTAAAAGSTRNADLVLPSSGGGLLQVGAQIIVVNDQIQWVLSQSTETKVTSAKRLVQVNQRARKCRPWARSMAMFTHACALTFLRSDLPQEAWHR